MKVKKIFKTFKIKEKIKELKKQLGDDDNIFAEKCIIVAVPSYDESIRRIEEDDKELFISQKQDANTIAHFIMEHTQADIVDVIWNINHLDKFSYFPEKAKIDCLILLHEFIESEKQNTILSIRKHCIVDDKDFRIIELY